MDFINRKKELKYIDDHLKSESNSLLFVYGPKSSFLKKKSKQYGII